MPKEKAKNNYLGKNGPRLNCAQSVAAAFTADQVILDNLSACGRGEAPDGWCGAAHAAKALTQNGPLVEKTYVEKAGSVKCAEIRKNRKLSCVGCVELGAELTEKLGYN
jgi:hypothetical protein